jgi:hypothetical protein
MKQTSNPISLIDSFTKKLPQSASVEKSIDAGRFFHSINFQDKTLIVEEKMDDTLRVLELRDRHPIKFTILSRYDHVNEFLKNWKEI